MSERWAESEWRFSSQSSLRCYFLLINWCSLSSPECGGTGRGWIELSQLATLANCLVLSCTPHTAAFVDVAIANELIALQLISFLNTAGAVIVVNLRISATKSQRRLLFLHLLVVSQQHLGWRVCVCVRLRLASLHVNVDWTRGGPLWPLIFNPQNIVPVQWLV